MACCGPGGLARKLAALEATPFFKALQGSNGVGILEQVAKDAVLRKLKIDETLDDVALGTFVIVVEGELVHTEVKAPARRSSFSGALSVPSPKVQCETSTGKNGASPAGGMSAEVIATRKVGDFFRLAGSGGGGKAAKLADLSRVVATQKTVILLLTPTALGKLDGGENVEFTNIIKEMAREDLATIISRVPIFEPLDRRTKNAVAQLFTYEVVPPKSVVFNEGEKGDWFLVLLHGELDVLQGGEKVATRSGTGTFLGEIALLYNCERTAAVHGGASSVASVLSLRAEHFQRLLDRVPDLRAQVESFQRSRMIYSFFVFSKMYGEGDTEAAKSAECAAIAKHVTVRLVPPGEVLVDATSAAARSGPGQTGNDAFYMVYQGTMRRTQHDGCGERSPKTRSIQKGGYAGGVAMLRMDGTTEFISAKSSCLVLEATGAQFYALLSLLPRLHAEVALRAHGRKAPLDAILNHPKAMAKFTDYQKSEYASESSEFYTDVTMFRQLSEKGAGSRSSFRSEPASPAAVAAPPPVEEQEESEEEALERMRMMRCSAVELVAEFVREDAPRQINVPAEMRQKIEEMVDSGDASKIDVTIFNEAQTEIFNLMKKDTLPRFVNSELFDEVLIGLGEETPLPDVKSVGFAEGLEEARAAFEAMKAAESLPAAPADYAQNYGAAPAPAAQ